MKRAKLVINLEHLAQFHIEAVPAWKVDPTEEPKNFGVSNSAPFLVNLVKQAAQRYGFVIRPEVVSTVPGDLGGYAPLGVARIQGIHSGPLYHTSGDVVESISDAGLEKAARFYAYVIEQAARAPAAQINPPTSTASPAR
jgi:acetylornithine deacetylase/succinyl-diaminopimelate desuccinylase-like protein